MKKIKNETVIVNKSSLEAMADNIKSIAKSMKDLCGEGKLTEDALITLVQRNCDPPSNYQQNQISRSDIKKVINSLKTLDNFVQKKKAA